MDTKGSCRHLISVDSLIAPGAALAGGDAGVVSAGEEGFHGEVNPSEDVAGALGAAHIAGLAADLSGDTIVEAGDQQLGKYQAQR